MDNVRILRYDWHTGHLGYGNTGEYYLARQYNHLSDMVVMTHAPVLDNYYLIVSMKETEDGDAKTLEPIQLSGSYWLIPNVYTQLVQEISFQFCCKTESGDFESHSAEIRGRILPSKDHSGEALDVNPSVMFDPYKKWVEGIAMAAGAIVIDSELSDASTNPVQNKVIKAAIDGITEDINVVDERVTGQQIALSKVEEKVPIVDTVAENYIEVKPDNWHNIDADTIGYRLKADGTTVESAGSFYTDYISVAPGDVIRAYHKSSHNKVYHSNYTYYDSSKNVLPALGGDTITDANITVPDGAAYIRITLETSYQSSIIITINLEPSDWSIQYFTPYYALNQSMITDEYRENIENSFTNVNRRLTEHQTVVTSLAPKIPILNTVAENYLIVNPDNWHNIDEDTVGILKADGTIVEAANKYYTDFIPVAAGDIIRAYHKTTHNQVDTYNFACYDHDMNLISSAGSDVSRKNRTVPELVSYVRMTLPLEYQSGTIITINLEPTDWSIQYFTPYCTLANDMLTDETKDEIDRLIESGGATLEPVKGYNLIPFAETGVGAYYANGNKMSYNATYTTYRYAIIPVKENTRYYINGSPRWWGVTDANGVVKASGTGFTPAAKKYIDVPTDGATLYMTYSESGWVQEETYGSQFAIIVAEGINGTRTGHKAPSFVTDLTQRMRKSTYACALPKASLQCTVGIEQKWYQKNMFSVDGDYASFFASSADAAYNYKWRSFTPNSAGTKNLGYYYMVYDDQMILVDQFSAVNEYFYADNVADASVLVIGDSTVAAGRETQTMLDMWTERGKTLTLLGTLGTAPNLHEGRSGASAKGYCTSTITGGASNPFYNSVENKFDFTQYMTAQEYASVDFVIIQLGTNDIFNAGMSEVEDVIAESMGYICQIIDSILAFNPSQKILINLPAAVNPNASTFNMKFKHNIFVRFNAAMLMELTKYDTANVRVSYNHLRLDPETDINDHVHPTPAGYAKMGIEAFSQINAWQQS